MSRLCERPGCSAPGAAAYGMVAEDLVFWIAPLTDVADPEPGLLCQRHADAMVVPRGWTLDDRREASLRLFKPRPAAHGSRSVASDAGHRRRTGRRSGAASERGEQLQIDGTGEIERPVEPADSDEHARPGRTPEPTDASVPVGALEEVDTVDTAGEAAAVLPIPGRESDPDGDDAGPWRPSFDTGDDLDGLLAVSTPLLSRAFRGDQRRRA